LHHTNSNSRINEFENMTSLPSSNRAVVWVGARKVEIQQRDVISPKADEVLVKVVSTGICGSDCHNWESDELSRHLVMGHESSGIVEQIGSGVQDRTVGQRVAIEPGFACMEYSQPVSIDRLVQANHS
jgi:D-xylulose reductase